MGAEHYSRRPGRGRSAAIRRGEASSQEVIDGNPAGFAAAADPGWARPEGGYQIFIELFVGDDAESRAVTAKATAR
jgi:hypothetical protein